MELPCLYLFSLFPSASGALTRPYHQKPEILWATPQYELFPWLITFFKDIKAFADKLREIIMGRIKTKDIKRTGESLFKNKPELFSNDFNTNKAAVRDMKIAESKRVRNKIVCFVPFNTTNFFGTLIFL